MAISDLQPRAKNIAQSATTSGTWQGTGATVGNYYRLTVTAGATAGAAGNATQATTATFNLTAVSNANKLPAAGTTGTTTYTLQESTDNVTYTSTGITNVTVTRLPNAPTTSAAQNFNTTTTSSTFTHAIVYTAGAAPSGTIEFAVSTSANTYAAVTGWTTTNSFTLTRGTTYFFWTRSAADALAASVQQLQAPYVSPGLATGITGAAVNSTISSATTSTVLTRTGTYTAPSTYRLIRDPSTVVGTGTQATYTLSGAELPPNAGQVYTYTYQASLAVLDGGNAGWVTCTGAGSTFSITRETDTTPDAFTFTDVTGAALSTQYTTFVQITGINSAATVSRTLGAGEFSVSATTTPGTWGTTNTTITNNQYLHVRQTSSPSVSTAVSTTMSVGGVTDAWVVTTGATADETPESYTNLASNITGAGHNQQYFASFAATAPALGGGVLLGGVATAPTYTVSGLGAGVTVTASVTAGNASFSITGVFGTYYTSASVTNGTVIICQFLTPNTVNTAETYTLQIGTVSRSVTITTGAVLPDRLVNLTVTPYGTGVIPFGQTSATVQVSGGTSGHEYTIGSGSGTNGIETVLATPVAADGSGNATITIPNANLPTNATQWVNRLRVRAPAGIGGNNIWSTWGTGSINGGASGNLIWNWSRATSATTLGVGTVSRTPAGDISGSITSVVVNFTGTINHKYKLVQTAPSVTDMVVGSVLGATGATSLTLTSAASALPGENNVWTYKVQVMREIANGGDGIWYDATGTAVSFTIFRIYNPTVANDQGFDTTYNNTFFTHQMKLKVEGNGGIHEFAYADTGSSTGTYPTTWSTDRSCVVARGTSYYFWSRRRAPGGPSTDASDFDRIDTPVEVPAWQGIDVTDSTYGIQINNASGVPVLTMASRIIRLLDSGTTAAVAAGASYTSPPISSIDTYINSHVAIISPSDAVYKLNSFSVSVDYTAKTFTVINNTGSSKTFSFYVFRSG